MPETAVLARREGVELVRTGRWEISTGTWHAAREDIAAAVAALSCPAVQKPIVKIGHKDKRFNPGDGEPAIGWFDNLRITDGGHTLVADQVAPAWLTEVQAAAWPNRSVEGSYNKRCGLGHTHPFVLTAVSLLGVTPPGVATLTPLNSLDDVKALFGVAASQEDPGDGEVRIVASLRAAADDSDDEPVHTGAMVALIPRAEDAERLAVDGGEDADELHVTLAYLGEAAEFTAKAQAAVIDAVRRSITDMPTLDAQAFAVSVFNPPGIDASDGKDRDTCIVLGVGGDDLEYMQALAASAARHAALQYGVELPDQHRPWVPHITLTYTEDLTQVAELADRCGPVEFDRVRVAFAGEHTDIPLTAVPGWEPLTDLPVEAAAGDDDQLKRFWTKDPRGLAKWAKSRHPWTALFKHLRKHMPPEKAKRVTSAWYRDVFGHMPNQRKKVAAEAAEGEVMPNPTPSLAERIHRAWNASGQPEQQWIVEAAEDEVIVMDNTDRSLMRVPVTVAGDDITFGVAQRVRPAYVPADEPVAASRLVFASADESRPAAPAIEPPPAEPPPAPEPAAEPAATPEAPANDGGFPVPPAAEPDNAPSTEPKEDHVSTLSTDVRSRLGLTDDADEQAMLAAIDELKSKADTAPTPDQIAASAAEADDLRKEVTVLASQVQTLSSKLAATEAEKAATVKASVLDDAVKLGKIAPADKEQWEKDYDEAPGAITRVLASIAPGTAVPIAAAGTSGPGEPDTTDDLGVTDDALNGWASQLGVDAKELTR